MRSSGGTSHRDALFCQRDVLRIDLVAEICSLVVDGCDRGSAAADEGIEDDSSLKGIQLHQTGGQFYRERCWMADLAGGDRREGPDAFRVFQELITTDRVLSFLRRFVV